MHKTSWAHHKLEIVQIHVYLVQSSIAMTQYLCPAHEDCLLPPPHFGTDIVLLHWNNLEIFESLTIIDHHLPGWIISRSLRHRRHHTTTALLGIYLNLPNLAFFFRLSRYLLMMNLISIFCSSVSFPIPVPPQFSGKYSTAIPSTIGGICTSHQKIESTAGPGHSNSTDEQLAAVCAACNKFVMKDTKPVVRIHLKHPWKTAQTPSNAPAAAAQNKAISAVNQTGFHEERGVESVAKISFLENRSRRWFHFRRFSRLLIILNVHLNLEIIRWIAKEYLLEPPSYHFKARLQHCRQRFSNFWIETLITSCVYHIGFIASSCAA